MAIKWRSEYSCGVVELDRQHQFFMALINRIALEFEGASTEGQLGLLEELRLYAHFHFKSEENFLTKLSYPRLEEMRMAHRKLIENLVNSDVLISSNAGNPVQVVEMLIGWFEDHMLREDAQIGPFIESLPFDAL